MPKGLFSPIAGFKGILAGLEEYQWEWLPISLLGLLTLAKLLGYFLANTLLAYIKFSVGKFSESIRVQNIFLKHS